VPRLDADILRTLERFGLEWDGIPLAHAGVFVMGKQTLTPPLGLTKTAEQLDAAMRFLGSNSRLFAEFPSDRQMFGEPAHHGA
jgi:hypothetical protein